jgi:hypothetical protein
VRKIRAETILPQSTSRLSDSSQDAFIRGVSFRFAQQEPLQAYSYIDADQRSIMPLAQVSQAAGEVFERGGPRQFKDSCAGFEHGHHAILRRVLDLRILHGISFLGFVDPCRKLDCKAELATCSGNGIFR